MLYSVEANNWAKWVIDTIMAVHKGQFWLAQTTWQYACESHATCCLTMVKYP